MVEICIYLLYICTQVCINKYIYIYCQNRGEGVIIVKISFKQKMLHTTAPFTGAFLRAKNGTKDPYPDFNRSICIALYAIVVRFKQCFKFLTIFWQ